MKNTKMQVWIPPKQHNPVPKVWIIAPVSILLLGNATTTELFLLNKFLFLLTILAISYRKIQEEMAFEN